MTTLSSPLDPQVKKVVVGAASNPDKPGGARNKGGKYFYNEKDQSSFEEALFDHIVESFPGKDKKDKEDEGTRLIKSIGTLSDYSDTKIHDINIGNKSAKIVAFHGPNMQNPNVPKGINRYRTKRRDIDKHYSPGSFKSVEAYVKDGLKNPQERQAYKEMLKAYRAFFEIVVDDLKKDSYQSGVVVIVPKICGKVYAAQYRVGEGIGKDHSIHKAIAN